MCVDGRRITLPGMVSVRRVVPLVALLLLGPLGVDVGARPTDEGQRESYTPGAAGAPVDCDNNLGGACFDLPERSFGFGLVVADPFAPQEVPAGFRFYDAGGGLLGTGAFCTRTTGTVPAGAVLLEVHVSAVALGECGAAAVAPAVNGGEITLTLDDTPNGPPPPVDAEIACSDGAPFPASSYGTTDDGRDVTYDVHVLVDALEQARAEELFALAQEPYTAYGITLRATYEAVAFDAVPLTTRDMIAAGKAYVGGTVPKGVDVVYVLTGRDLIGPAGTVDCLGGVRSPERAFAASEVDAGPPNLTRGQPVPVWPWGDGSAKTLAHELGHLLGASHELANCVEGVLYLSDLPRPCTLMHANLGLAMRFSSVNALVVRGHALEFAADEEKGHGHA
jgi:hypothetical protein